MNTQVAANDMADIFSFREPAVITNIIGSGKMLNFNDHKDKLPSVYNLEVYKNAIDYMTTTYGGANKGLYAMPIRIGPNKRVDSNVTLRYDVYKQIGSPSMNTMEDLLPVLKRMQDAYPANAAGQKVYGFALWAEWDKVGIAPLTYMVRTMGYDLEYASNSVAIYADGSKAPVSIIDENGPYYRALKFCFQANQMGLLDPDSLTHRYEALQAKGAAGRYLYYPVFWADTFNGTANAAASTAATTVSNANAGVGFMQVPWKDAKCIAYADYPIGESMNVWGIPKNTKNLDAALKFFDWWSSYEGSDITSNGPRGLIWDIDASGLRYITPQGWTLLSKSATEGGFDASSIGESGLSALLLNPATKGQTIGFGTWESTIAYNNQQNKLLQTWAADHNTTLLDTDIWMTQNGYSVKELAAIRAMPAMPTEIENMTNLICDVVKTASWQAIYATSEAQFNSIWRDAQTKANGLGMPQVLQWTTQAWNQAKIENGKYTLPAGL
jgi:hypothetical protein